MPELMNFLSNVDLKGYSLIIPTVSVANVPQLTVDLIINTYHLKKSATLWHPAIEPSVGGDPYGEDVSEICTAFELYTNQSDKVAVIQIRSSVEVSLVKKFIEDLCTALVNLNLKNVWILSSAFDYEMKNINMERFYYVSNQLDNKTMESNGVKNLEKSINNRYVINGGGFGTRLYEVFSENFKCTLLGKYVSEGDNRPDAIALFHKLANIMGLQLNTADISFPSSWQYVFGGPPPLGLY